MKEGCIFLQLLSIYFPILKCNFKNSKGFAYDTLIFNIHILRFKMVAGLNLNFLVQGAVSFHPSVGHKNQPNP